MRIRFPQPSRTILSQGWIWCCHAADQHPTWQNNWRLNKIHMITSISRNTLQQGWWVRQDLAKKLPCGLPICASNLSSAHHSILSFFPSLNFLCYIWKSQYITNLLCTKQSILPTILANRIPSDQIDEGRVPYTFLSIRALTVTFNWVVLYSNIYFPPFMYHIWLQGSSWVDIIMKL